MLPRQNFGWHHQSTLGAAFHCCGHRQQGDDSFAGAHIALQQADHAIWAGHIGQDFQKRTFLSAGKAIGQVSDNLLAQCPRTAKRSPAGTFHLGAHQSQRQLVGQKLIIGQPAAVWPFNCQCR